MVTKVKGTRASSRISMRAALPAMRRSPKFAASSFFISAFSAGGIATTTGCTGGGGGACATAWRGGSAGLGAGLPWGAAAIGGIGGGAIMGRPGGPPRIPPMGALSAMRATSSSTSDWPSYMASARRAASCSRLRKSATLIIAKRRQPCVPSSRSTASFDFGFFGSRYTWASASSRTSSSRNTITGRLGACSRFSISSWMLSSVTVRPTKAEAGFPSTRVFSLSATGAPGT